MDIEEIFKKTRQISEASGRNSHGIRHSNDLRKRMSDIADKHHFTIGQVYDMALFQFLNSYEEIDMSQYPELKKEAKSNKSEGYPNLCIKCEDIYNTAEYDSCPRCSK